MDGWVGGCICRLTARGPRLQGLGFSGRFERLGGTDDAIPVLSSPMPCPFSCRSAAWVTTAFSHHPSCAYRAVSWVSTCHPAECDPWGVLEPPAPRHPCTDRPPQPRAAGTSTWHGRWTFVPRVMSYCPRLPRFSLCYYQSYEYRRRCAHLYTIQHVVTPTGAALGAGVVTRHDS